MPKSSCFRTPFRSQRVHLCKTLLKSARQHFYPTFPLMQDKLSWKTSLWIRSKISGMLVSTLADDHMYSPHSWQKFPQRIQTQLFKKAKIIPEIFIAFLKSTWNFVHLENKDQLDSLYSFKVINSEKCTYLNAKKLLFQNTLRESTCSQVQNTGEIYTTAPVS